MRKYLLLATTAMLFAGNAMAGSIAKNRQSAVVGAKAKIVGMSVITGATDMDVGTLAVDTSYEIEGVIKIATLGTNSEVDIENSDYVISKGGTPAATVVTVTGNQHVGISIDSPTMYHTITNGSGIYLSDFTIDSTNPNQYKIGASVYVDASVDSVYNTPQENDQVFTVTLQY